MEKNTLVQWAAAAVIRRSRTEQGLSQSQLADFSGLTLPHGSAIEQGKMGISVAAFLQLAEALHLSGHELMLRLESELQNGPVRPAGKRGRPARLSGLER